MAVYKFKLFIEDNEDIYREIEILSGQTFEDFHNAIQDAYKFDKKHAASFFVSDDYWRKDQLIGFVKKRRHHITRYIIQAHTRSHPIKLFGQSFLQHSKQQFLKAVMSPWSAVGQLFLITRYILRIFPIVRLINCKEI